MKENKIVQFVCFETTLDKEDFILKWDQYTRSVNSNLDVTMQQSEKNGVFTYIAQHRCASEFKFVFTKAARSSRNAETKIKGRQAGGYSILQEQRMNNTHNNESKIFAFLTDPRADLDTYRQLSPGAKLNIYEAYYENCQYAYILEYFVKTKNAEGLMDQMKIHDVTDTAIYKECVLEVV